MKHYIYNGKSYDKIPDPFLGTSPMYDRVGSNFIPRDELFVELGGTIEDDGQLSPFEEACAQFREVCAAIGEFIGDADFRGGFDEYTIFAVSQAFLDNPILGNTLAIQWSGCNERCKYEGAKIGLDQPAWWYKCWELADAETENLNE